MVEIVMLVELADDAELLPSVIVNWWTMSVILIYGINNLVSQ
jgi:hypothetical protein